MKIKTLFLSLLLVGLLSTNSLFAPNIQASGDSTTQQDSEPGQVLIESDDGVMFLSTETNDEVTLNEKNRLTSIAPIVSLPAGFAQNLADYINALLSFVMIIAALLVFYFLIIGAINWITSGGDKGKVETARNKIVTAVIGIIIVASSYALLLLVLNFLGFKNLEEVFSNIKNIQGESSVAPKEAGYVTLCGDGNIDQEFTICNQGCSLTDKACSHNEPYVAKYTCQGYAKECRDNRSELDTKQQIEENLECNTTIEIDVFQKNCLEGDKNWNCTEDDLLDYMVWYSGDC